MVSKMKTGFQIVGSVTLTKKNRAGWRETVTLKNMVVNWGLVNLAGVIAGVPFPSTISYLAMGGSDTSTSLADTALVSELIRDSATVTQLAAPTDNSVQFQVAHAEGAVVGTFKEAGLFDAAAAGNMFNRITFPDFVVGSSDTLTVTWLIEIRNS